MDRRMDVYISILPDRMDELLEVDHGGVEKILVILLFDKWEKR